jgi:hypothetical protein
MAQQAEDGKFNWSEDSFDLFDKSPGNINSEEVKRFLDDLDVEMEFETTPAGKAASRYLLIFFSMNLSFIVKDQVQWHMKILQHNRSMVGIRDYIVTSHQ